VNHTGKARHADLVLENPGAVVAFDDDDVGSRQEQPFGPEIEAAGERVAAVMQAAAVWRLGVKGVRREAGVETAFGAMAMHDIGFGRRDVLPHLHQGGEIAQSGRAAHRETGEAKRERGGNVT
jgi:hypothetical protein